MGVKGGLNPAKISSFRLQLTFYSLKYLFCYKIPSFFQFVCCFVGLFLFFGLKILILVSVFGIENRDFAFFPTFFVAPAQKSPLFFIFALKKTFAGFPAKSHFAKRRSPAPCKLEKPCLLNVFFSLFGQKICKRAAVGGRKIAKSGGVFMVCVSVLA